MTSRVLFYNDVFLSNETALHTTPSLFFRLWQIVRIMHVVKILIAYPLCIIRMFVSNTYCRLRQHFSSVAQGRRWCAESVITIAEEQQLSDTGVTAHTSCRIFFCGLHLCLRGGDEHRDLEFVIKDVENQSAATVRPPVLKNGHVLLPCIILLTTYYSLRWFGLLRY